MDSSVVSLKNRQEVADGTMAFHLEKPPGFHFKAGQALDVTLLDLKETDPEGNSRAFSIVSPPYADDLVVATRMRDTPFKRFLRTAPLETPVRIDGPSGSFTLHNKHVKPAVFLAGGIGITPFVSILRQAARDKPPHKLYLFYSNRRPEDAAFLRDLEALERQNSGFHLVATMTRMENSSREWKGEIGEINREMLVKHLPVLGGPIYYIAGPSAMVTALAGAHVGTMPWKVLDSLFQHPLTDKGLSQFMKDWEKTKQSWHPTASRCQQLWRSLQRYWGAVRRSSMTTPKTRIHKAWTQTRSLFPYRPSENAAMSQKRPRGRAYLTPAGQET